MKTFRAFAAALIASSLAAATSAAQSADTPSGFPVPRFVSLKSEKTNGRIGPSLQHETRWLVQREGLPVLVIAESGEAWRKIRDPEGDEMWVHALRVSGRATAIVTAGAPLDVRRSADPASDLKARLAPGVIVEILSCEAARCRVKAEGQRGFVDAGRLWGPTDAQAAVRAASLD